MFFDVFSLYLNISFSCQVDFCVTPLVEAKTVWDKRNAVSQKQCPTVWLSLLVCMFR